MQQQLEGEEEEIVLVSSPVDAGISCWSLRSGKEHLRYRSCTSPPHGLACIGHRFLAASQLRNTSSSVGSVLYWSWNKPQPDVKSFPAEPINPLVSNTDGTYLIGGGSSGNIYLWEVASGMLLKKWSAHYRAVTCLAFSDDESLLISGAEDGYVKVWSLINLFDDRGDKKAIHPYLFSFSEHTLQVTDVVSGYGGAGAIIVSSSEDHTCKVWSLSKGKSLRTITFPSIIDAIALDPGEHAFYAGCRDGKIYIAALSAESISSKIFDDIHILGALSDNSKVVTCLAFSMDGTSLVSGSDDGRVRVWNTKTRSVVHTFKHAKGPISNILVLRRPLSSSPQTPSHAQGSISKRHRSLLPPPLDKYLNSMNGNEDARPVKALKFPCDESLDHQYFTSHVMTKQINELQQKGSSASSEIELGKLRLDCKRSLQMLQQWKKMYQDLVDVSFNKVLDRNQAGDAIEDA